MRDPLKKQAHWQLSFRLILHQSKCINIVNVIRGETRSEPIIAIEKIMSF